MAENRLHEPAAVGCRFPDANTFIHPRSGEMLAVRAPRDGVDPIGVVAERIEPFTASDVPDFYGAICGSGGKQLAVRAERQAVNRVAMILERADLLARRRIPELDEPI